MINDSFFPWVMAGSLGSIAVGSGYTGCAAGILIVTLIFANMSATRIAASNSYRPYNAFLQEYISGMSVVQLFNRDAKPWMNLGSDRDNMLAWRDAFSLRSVYRQSNFSASTIALFFGRRQSYPPRHISLGILTALPCMRSALPPIQDLARNSTSSPHGCLRAHLKLLDTATVDRIPMPFARTSGGEIDSATMVQHRKVQRLPRRLGPRMSLRVTRQTIAILANGAGKTTLIPSCAFTTFSRGKSS